MISSVLQKYIPSRTYVEYLKEKGHEYTDFEEAGIRYHVITDDEVPAHRKRSNSASRSVSGKRSGHKHDYEKAIIKVGMGSFEYYWGRRCRACGRVDDSGMFKPGASEDFVKASKEVRFNSGETYIIREFYSVMEIKKKFSGVHILKYDFKLKKYEEVSE